MSDTKMTERNMLPKVGASFFRGSDGEVLFQFVLDTSNVIGPRPARRSDLDQHPGAWSAFAAAEWLSSLDRDASGEAGGSLPVESVVPVEAVAPSVVSYESQGAGYDAGAAGYELQGRAPAPASAPKPKRKYTRKSEA